MLCQGQVRALRCVQNKQKCFILPEQSEIFGQIVQVQLCFLFREQQEVAAVGNDVWHFYRLIFLSENTIGALNIVQSQIDIRIKQGVEVGR